MYTFKTNRKCPKCGHLLRTTDFGDYGFVCNNCDENFYEIELKDNVDTVVTVPNFKETTKTKEEMKKGYFNVDIDKYTDTARISNIKIPLHDLFDKLKGEFKPTIEGLLNSGDIVGSIVSESRYRECKFVINEDSEDITAAIENTLHYMLDNDFSDEDIYYIMGAEVTDLEEEDLYIDLGYVIKGPISSFTKK